MKAQSTINKFKTAIQNIICIDFFSIKPSERISFNNKNSLTSSIGIFSSWIIIILTLITFINISKNMIYRSNPFNVISQILTPYPENFELYPENFFFAFGLQDLKNSAQHYIDESIYTVEVIKRTKIETKMTLEYLNASLCNINLFQKKKKNKNYFIKNNVDLLYCIQDYNEIVPELKGEWTNPLYKNILINVKGCKNSSNSNVICKPKEIIEAKLNNGNFAIYFTNLAINPNDYENPLTSYGKFLYTPISYNTSTYIEMVFQHLSFITDEGILFEDLKELDTVNYLTNRQILTNNPDQSVQVDLKLDHVKTIYNRKYDKIPDILARLGGIIKAIMLIMKFLIMPFIQLNFNKKIVNSIYEIQVPCENKKINEDKIKKNKIKKKINRPKNLNNVNEIFHPDQNIFNKLDSKIEIGFFQYIFSYFKSEVLNIKKKLLKTGVLQINKNLDIKFIISKLVEIDKLKKILLTKDQLQLFHYMKKPKLSLNESKNYPPSNPSILKSTKIFNSFVNLCTNEHKNDIDRKLIELAIHKTDDKIKLQNLILKFSEKQNPSVLEKLLDKT